MKRIAKDSTRRLERPLQGALLPLPESEAPEAESLTKQQQSLFEAAVEIRERWPAQPDLAYMAKHLVQVTLPHRDPGDVPYWSRSNGSLTLVISRSQIDEETGDMIGYPYGTIPRLLMYWITREAVVTRNRRLELGRSLAEFMREVGLNPNNGSGKRSDAYRLRNQMTRLFASSISFQSTAPDGSGRRWLNMPVSRGGQLWWDPKNHRQSNLWQSWIELGEDFYNAITSSPVPVDTRALRALNNSPLALDLYGWATYKTYQTSRSGKPQTISYQDLMNQLGADYSDRKNFKKKILATLKKVQAVYPELKMEPVVGGIRVDPGRPAVPASIAKPATG